MFLEKFITDLLNIKRLTSVDMDNVLSVKIRLKSDDIKCQ